MVLWLVGADVYFGWSLCGALVVWECWWSELDGVGV